MTRLMILNKDENIALTGTEAYSEPCQTSKIELFVKIVGPFRRQIFLQKAWS